jgi:hypothetical protein
MTDSEEEAGQMLFGRGDSVRHLLGKVLGRPSAQIHVWQVDRHQGIGVV